MSSYLSSIARHVRSASSASGRGSELSGSSASDSSSEEDEEDEECDEVLQLPPELQLHLDTISVLGSTGWSSQISCTYYDEALSLIFAGTEEGSLYVHGRDQQWMRPARGKNPNRVVSISRIPLEADENTAKRSRVFLLLGDGSIELWEFNWESITLVDAKTPADIGCHKDEKVVTVMVDEAGGYPFVYLGTSRGGFQVIECSSTSSIGIRLCEYRLPQFSKGISSMALVSMKICPKDERYIGLSYCDFLESGKGLVIIYDLSKQKISSQYNSLGVVLSLEWDHRGNVLFAGTAAGEVFVLKIKQKEEGALQIWKYSGESSDDMQIRKLAWLAPQEGEKDDEENSCLFALIGTADDEDGISNPISCAIMALHFDLAASALTECLMFPPPPDENITDFNIISCGQSPAALLMLSQRLNVDWTGNSLTLLRSDRFFRSLQLYPCPSSRTLDWELETGLLPDPIKVTASSFAVSGDGASASRKMTCLVSTIPSSSDKSLGMALIRSAAARPVEKGDVPCIRLASVSDSTQTKTSGVRASYIRGDVALVGDSEGGISVFRVNPLKSSSSSRDCVSTYWSLLHQFRLGTSDSPVNKFSVHEVDGIFIASNDAGEVGVWQASDTVSAPRLLSVYSTGEVVTAISLTHGSDDGSVKVFIGTKGGSLFFDSIFDKKSKSSSLKRVKTKLAPQLRSRSKEICSLHASLMRVSGQMVPVIFAVYTSGVVEAVSTSDGAPVPVAYGDMKQMAERKASHAQINAICVTDGHMNIVGSGSSGDTEGAGHPTYLVASVSSALVFYHLETFVLFNQASAPSAPSATIKPVSNCNILKSAVLQFGGNNFLCLVDATGVAALVSLDRRHPPACYEGLLDKIFKQQYPSVVRDASVCGNGDAFLLVGDIIFAVKLGNSAIALPFPPPASIDIDVPKPCKAAEALRTGREDFVVKRKKDIETRRMSMITMGVVTDLRKTFANTRSEMSTSYEDEDEEEEEGEGRLKMPSSLTVQSANAKSNDAMTNMAEARRNLELRGEKLEELQEKSEELAQQASQYQSDASRNRKNLEKKKMSWSFF